MKTTVGQLLINAALPEGLRDFSRTIDKKSLNKLLTSIHERYPDRYTDIVQKLNNVGEEIATADGGSFTLDDFILPDSVEAERDKVKELVNDLLAQGGSNKVVDFFSKSRENIQSNLESELLKRNNAFAYQAKSGTRGSPESVRSLLYGDLLVQDHRDRPIPIAILRSYSEGLSPAEYWAATYGARKGLSDVKFLVADAGAWAKQTVQALHQVIATDSKPMEGTGLSIDTDDRELPGYVLARPYGNYKAGTIVTPAIQRELQQKNKRVLVHSAIEALDIDGGGLPKVAAGVRERGALPPTGENVGILAAQALAEKLSQSQLSSKHSSGVVGSRKQTVGGFELINNLIQVPKTFRGASPVASVDGRVSKIVNAPQGGSYLYLGDSKHYIPPEQTVLVKVGDALEAGDRLTDGIPNPAEVVKHKGIGEGRRQFAKYFMQAFTDAGLPAHRRNAEVLARGLINHVRIADDQLDQVPGFLPGDVAEYDALASSYSPREGTKKLKPSLAVGKFLEVPALHYSIGSRITPSYVKHLEENDVPEIAVHDNPPPFEPEMRRALDVLSISPDWMTRFGGSYQQRGLLEATHRGRKSELPSKSYIPAVVTGAL